MKRNRTAIVLICSIPLMLLVGAYRPWPAQYLNPDNQTETRFWVVKTYHPPTYDLLVIGDSRVLMGISPEAMQPMLPDYRILNFGFGGAGLNSMLFEQAESKLDPSSTKKIIVIGVTPRSLMPVSLERSNLTETLQFSSTEIFFYLYYYPTIQFLAPLSNEEIKIALPAPIETVVRSRLDGDNAVSLNRRYFEYYEDGWMARAEAGDRQIGYDQVLPEYTQIFTGQTISPTLMEGVLQQTTDWTDQGIQVFGFRPPSSSEILALETELSDFDEAYFTAQFEAAGGVWLPISPDPTLYDSFDGSHLMKESAVLLSEEVARQIASHLNDN